MSLYRIKGSSGPVLNQAWPLGSELVIGSEAGADVALDGLSAAGDVARLSLVDGAVTLIALDAACPVFLNGEAVETASLGSGDEIRIGAARFILQAPGLKPERVLGQFMGLAAPAGKHTVEFRFSPRVFWIGFWWSIVSVLLFVLVAVKVPGRPEQEG